MPDRNLSLSAFDAHTHSGEGHTSTRSTVLTFFGIVGLVGGFASALLGLAGILPALLAVPLSHFQFGLGLGLLKAPVLVGLLVAAVPLLAAGATPLTLLAAGIGAISYAVGRFLQ